MTTPSSDPDCGCQRALMMSMSPLHPFTYIELACDEHRKMFKENSLSLSVKTYEPTNVWREAMKK